MATSTRVKVICDDTQEVLKSLHTLIDEQIIIGIDENSERSAGDGEYIQNAMVGYAMEFGSPAQNVPARPFLVPGTTKALPKMLPKMEDALRATFSNNVDKARADLRAAGAIGVASVRNEMSTAGYAPLKPATIANRARQRGEPRTAEENHYLFLVAGGIPSGVAQAMAGIQPLINSGQLRDAITSSVRVGGKR